MTTFKTTYNRRSFLKVSAVSSGGLLLGFNWLVSCTTDKQQINPPSEWFNINSYLSIADNGQITIMSPNPEIGQNVKTSFPMVVAEELDADWSSIIVKQAPLNTDWFQRQVAGGSQSLRQGWDGLRMAGATARQMLMMAAAKRWNVDLSTLKTDAGMIINANGDKLSYADVAAEAAKLEAPTEVKLKDPEDYKIIGKSTANVDLDNIITGKPLYGIDTKVEGMQYAAAQGPPAFGQKLKSFDDSAARQVKGVSNVFKIRVPLKEEGRFVDKVVVVASSTWAAFKGKKALKIEWEKESAVESSDFHTQTLKALLNKKPEAPVRNDGNVDARFAEADEVVERVYESPFLPHNCLEPMNFFANVTADKAELSGPVQTPEWTRSRLSESLGMDEKNISIDLTRMGGGFGRRLYGDFAVEAAEISKIAKSPIQLLFTREDDMTAGTYRPAILYKIKAAIKDKKITAYHLAEAAVNSNMYYIIPNNYPAGAISDYRVDNVKYDSNITTGAWRAPYSNFLASAEQAFFDELAEKLGVDVIDLHLQLLEESKKTYVAVKREEDEAMSMVDKKTGTEEEKKQEKEQLQQSFESKRGNYVPDKMIGVIKLVAEKANWKKAGAGVFQGFCVYYSHNTYVAEIADVMMEAGKPVVKKVTVAVDCGIVVNPVAAESMAKGGVVDGVGHAMYGDFAFVDGVPQASNFDKFRLIRTSEAPKVDVHFVKNFDSPTGLGEPTLPPAGGAVANAIYAATGKRLYKQPYAPLLEKVLG